MPTILLTSTSLLVLSRSSRLGWTFPDGWLWASISWAALAFIAGLNTSRGWMGQEDKVPTAIVGLPMTSFFVFKSRQTKFSRSRSERRSLRRG